MRGKAVSPHPQTSVQDIPESSICSEVLPRVTGILFEVLVDESDPPDRDHVGNHKEPDDRPQVQDIKAIEGQDPRAAIGTARRVRSRRVRSLEAGNSEG